MGRRGGAGRGARPRRRAGRRSSPGVRRPRPTSIRVPTRARTMPRRKPSPVIRKTQLLAALRPVGREDAAERLAVASRRPGRRRRSRAGRRGGAAAARHRARGRAAAGPGTANGASSGREHRRRGSGGSGTPCPRRACGRGSPRAPSRGGQHPHVLGQVVVGAVDQAARRERRAAAPGGPPGRGRGRRRRCGWRRDHGGPARRAGRSSASSTTCCTVRAFSCRCQPA